MARPKRPFEVVAGDTEPHLLLHAYVDVKQSDGTVVRQVQDITGWTFELFMERPPPYPPLVRTAEILEADQGIAAIQWEPGDWVPGRGQVAYVTRIDGNGEKRSFGEFVFNVAAKPTP